MEHGKYAEDWLLFKIAVISKNISKISAFASSDMVDAEELIMYISVNKEFQKILHDTKAIDLKNDGNSLEFCAVDSTGAGMDGVLHIFFTKGDKGLELDSFYMSDK